MLFPAHRSAGVDRRDDGNLQLRPDGDGTRHDGDVRHHVSRSGTETSRSSSEHSVCSTPSSKIWLNYGGSEVPKDLRASPLCSFPLPKHLKRAENFVLYLGS